MRSGSPILYAGLIVLFVGLLRACGYVYTGAWIGLGLVLVGIILAGIGLRQRLKGGKPEPAEIVIICVLILASVAAATGVIRLVQEIEPSRGPVMYVTTTPPGTVAP